MTQPKTLQNEGRTGHTDSASYVIITEHAGKGDSEPRYVPPEHFAPLAPRAPGKGRPRVWSKERLRVLVLRLVANHWKRRYCAPTLRQIAIAINATTPMSEEALKKLIQRHGLKWAELKKKIET